MAVTLGLLIGIVVFVSGGVPSAAAGYEALAAGPGATQADVVLAPAAPVAIATGSTVAVSWTAVALSGGQPVDGYLVERFDSLGAPVAVLTGCDILVVGTSCSETGVPPGTWTYRVRGVRGAWNGAPSDASAPITVAVATVAWSSPMPITALPAAVSGTIDHFVPGETLTFRLDSPTGAVLSGTPSTVGSTVGQPVSVSVPAGTSDAPHSIYVIGSAGTIAAAAISIVMPPVLQSLTMHDVDIDGRVDEVRATFDDVLAPDSAGIVPWTLTNVPSGGSLAAVSVSGTVATLTLTEGTGAASTAVGAFTVALAANAAGIRDVNGHAASFTATAPADAAAPAPVTMTLLDTNNNGKVNRLSFTWSETLAATSTVTTPWTLANVPSAGVRGTVSHSGTTGTINITEGAGAVDTAVGTMTVALAASATGPRDAAGNRSAFPARAPTDGARPVLVSFTHTNGAVDGRIEPGDTLSMLFSEPIPATAIPATVTVTLTDPNTTAADQLTITGLVNGARSLGGNGYVTTNNVSVSFAGSVVSFANSGRTVVVTVGAACSGTCAAVGTQTTNATVSIQPATTITDAAGNLVLTTIRTLSTRLF